MPDFAQELLTAARKFPLWQQDALRRLTAGHLQEGDYVDLVALAKSDGVVAAAGALQAVPLAAEHLSQAHSGGGVTTLLGLFDVEGVNALEAKQRLSFGPQGITVVFGRNGAGKSGYSRVLRCACRARKAPTIVPNVTKAGPILPPKATFLVRQAVGDSEVIWHHGKPSPQPLAHLAVFDRECEKDIVDERGEATFTPPVLNRFDELGQAVDVVKRRIEAEALAGRPTEDLQDLARQIAGASNLRDLLGTIIADQSSARYRTIADHVRSITWGPTQDEQLNSARVRLLAGGDPVTKALERRSLANSLQVIRQAAEGTEPLLGLAGEQAVRVAKSHAVSTAAVAAKAEAGIDFTSESAVNIGSLVWQQLYQSAVAFALTGFADEPRFPSADAKCPLCLQDLDGAARARIQRFQTFMSKEAKIAADKAQAALANVIATLTAFAVSAIDPHITQEAITKTTITADVLASIPRQLAARRERLISNAQGTEWVDLPPFPTTAVAALQLAETALETQAQEAERMGNPEVRAGLEATIKTLEATQAFAAQTGRLLTIIDRHAASAHLGRLASQINTRVITLEGKAVAERTITDGLKSAFREEMQILGAEGIVPASISNTAVKGKTSFSIALTGSTQHAKVGTVLSEGEQRVVALAYFLAEVRMAPDKVGIILDDPVSSLDYWWAERIAERIANLGAERQVIVFTHSIALAVEIEKHAAFTRAPVTKLYIQSGQGGSGRCAPEAAPWDSLSVGERLERFRKRLLVLRAEHAKAPAGRDYARLTAEFCGDLRSTWERAVEEFVFCGVIERFGNSVSTARLKGVVCTTETFKQVNEAMTKLSAITAAHDKARDAFATCPKPDELTQFIAKIEAFEKYQRDAKKVAVKEREPFESAPILVIPPTVAAAAPAKGPTI